MTVTMTVTQTKENLFYRQSFDNVSIKFLKKTCVTQVQGSLLSLMAPIRLIYQTALWQ